MIVKKGIAFVLAVVFVLSAAGCMPQVQAENLMDGITPNEVEAVDAAVLGEFASDFAVRLLQSSIEAGENTLISPISVMYALGMTANGAQGDTLAQMESVLGLSVPELNDYLYSFVRSLNGDLKLANSIWFTDHERFSVSADFLQVNADYYCADIYKTHFDDSALRDMNNWVREKTDGMIPQILDQIPDGAIMYLVNALAFDAEWEAVYEEGQVREGRFIREDDSVVDVEYLHSIEYRYMEDENATGFMKYYADRKYAFVALLPREGTSMEDFVASLTGQYASELFFPRYDGRATGGTFVYERVQVEMPKFETEYEDDLVQVLSEMGMPLAFDMDDADFAGLGRSDDGNIFLSRVLHKTFISVGEQGTRAGAATMVEMRDGAAIAPEEVREVCLDRPFVYLLIHVETGVPIFIGTMLDPAA